MQRDRGVHVAVNGRAGSVITSGVAGHGGDVVTGVGQGSAEPAADETGRSGDEHFHLVTCPSGAIGRVSTLGHPISVLAFGKGCGAAR